MLFGEKKPSGPVDPELKTKIMDWVKEITHGSTASIVGYAHIKAHFQKQGYSWQQIHDALTELYHCDKQLVGADHPMIDRGVWLRLAPQATNDTLQ